MISKKVTQAMLAMNFYDPQQEQNALPNAFMIQGDGDQVGAILITIMYSGEQNVSSVGQKRSRVSNSCIRKYDKVPKDVIYSKILYSLNE